jgi:hypothetical protein
MNIIRKRQLARAAALAAKKAETAQEPQVVEENVETEPVKPTTERKSGTGKAARKPKAAKPKD